MGWFKNDKPVETTDQEKRESVESIIKQFEIMGGFITNVTDKIAQLYNITMQHQNVFLAQDKRIALLEYEINKLKGIKPN